MRASKVASVLTFAGFVACIMHASPADACGAAYPAGSYVRLAGERTVIVWDAKNKTEHFIRKPLFEGDSKDFGFFVPTPTLPKIAKEKDELLERVELLVPDQMKGGHGGSGAMPGAVAAAPVEVLQKIRIDDFEIVTLKATDGDALGDWLSKHKFVDRPGLRTWAQRYLVKGWLLNAMRYAPSGTANRKVETPTLRISFAIDAPFYPYTEAPPEPADEAAFRAKYKVGGQPTRPLDVWIVAANKMEASQGENRPAGPMLDAASVVPADMIASALGDTTSWGFDPHGREVWAVTHLSENTLERVAFNDIVFREPDALGDAAAVLAGAHHADVKMSYPAGKKHGLTRVQKNTRFVFFTSFLAGLIGLLFVFLRDRSSREE
jgi:hypothetical protein